MILAGVMLHVFVHDVFDLIRQQINVDQVIGDRR